MEKVKIEYNTEDKLTKYRVLPKSGFSLVMCIGDKRITLEGQKVSTKISLLQQYIHKSEGIHVENQRIFLAGEELNPKQTLSNYQINRRCLLQVKSFVPVLISSLEAPGPMLTEVEVSPMRNESISEIKRRLEHKLGIKFNDQRLYLTVNEMTTFPRRRPLDDFSKLSRYLPSSCSGAVLEMRSKAMNMDRDNVLTLRLPISVQDARGKIRDHDIAETNSNDDIILPHTYHTESLPGWLSLEIETSKIIKRDPSISDIFKILKEKLNLEFKSMVGVDCSIKLKFCKNRVIHGDQYLSLDKKCEEDYQIRSDEQLLNIEIDGMLPPENSKTPMVPAPKPILPILSYEEHKTRYTMPKCPLTMAWNIPSSDELDLGANPSVVLEISAFSNSKFYESWDIVEHYKTYVEILLEGTFYVGDARRNNEILNGEITEDLTSKSLVYYVQQMMDITITGPENSLTINPHMVNTSPMKWYRKSAEKKDDTSSFWNQTLDRRIEEPVPLRFRNRSTNLPPRTKMDNASITYGYSGHSKLLIDNWYFGKERISDVTPRDGKQQKKVYFDALCNRGVTISGNPYVKVTFQSRNLNTDCEEYRSAFDFRIQAQFYICTLENDFKECKKPDASEKFTINIGQKILRTKRIPKYSDVTSEITSPSDSSMKTTLTVNLADGIWLNEKR